MLLQGSFVLQVTVKPADISGKKKRAESLEVPVWLFGAVKARFFENTCTAYSSLTQKAELRERERKKKRS